MLFAHLKRILRLARLRLRGPNGAKDEFLLAATAQKSETTRPPKTDQYASRKARRIAPRDGGPEPPPKQPFQPFSKTRRASPSDEILDGFFNGIRALRSFTGLILKGSKGRSFPFGKLSGNDRYLRKAEVESLQKRGAQHVRIKGQAVDLSPTDASASRDQRLTSGFYAVSIFSRSDRQRGVGGTLAVASSALGWRRRMGRGSVGSDYTSRKGSSAASPPDCLKVREAHSDESNALRRREHGTDQVEGDFMQPVLCLDRRFHRSATSGQLKVGPFDLHRHCPATRVRLLAPGPDIVSHRDHAGLDLNGID